MGLGGIMSEALFELYHLAESHGAPRQDFEKWAEKHYTPMKQRIAESIELLEKIEEFAWDADRDIVDLALEKLAGWSELEVEVTE